ncbi:MULTISPECIES: TlpA disulfide reductase family protein [Rhodanobacteraceae]|uniref:TlpA family protein disulfide reductase n=1 Tax=Rhodanobacteraceae TaxID=1775411 RepID=UPI00068A7A90|nr:MULTISPECIES: TlpA disulfide reductase family protein [Rhodanobacteraceae]MDR6644634.1 thiol-disulfide isomerase/thioredoxin [Luteibacter sp. 1214]SDG80386.1 Thiol-disulfide isomerase or thioredoxin [Dyella sp. 333MFSha]
MILRTLAVVALALATPAMAATAAKPELKVTTLEGKPFDLSAQHGKWVIVNYWATWCVPCIKEMPDISAFVKSRKDVVAIGLAFEDTDAKEIKAFVDKHPVVYPIAQLDVTAPPKDFDPPKGLPTTYLIAPDGHVAQRFVGPVTGEKLSEAIARGS